MLNNITVQGNLTKDPELKTTNNEKKLCAFTIACNRTQGATDYFDCVAWNGTAEFVDRFFSKGSQILINGWLSTKINKDRNGQERKTFEIVANNVNFCGNKTDKVVKTETFTAKPEDYTEVVLDSDLPF